LKVLEDGLEKSGAQWNLYQERKLRGEKNKILRMTRNG